MGSKGGQTAVSTSTPPADVVANYKYVTELAKQTAGTPYQAYTGELTPGLTQTQQQAIAGIPSATTAYQPYFGQAQGLIGQATQGYTPTAFSPEAISQYENPYTQDVIDATLANMRQEQGKQQSALQGNAIAAGAWGGDRAAIAANDLARQQELATGQTIAGLKNQNYMQALAQFNAQNQLGLNAAQLNQQAALQGAGLTGTLGAQATQLGLAGAGAGLQAGTLEQQTQAAKDAAAYQQFQQQQQYPFNTLSWLSGITSGLGAGMGGTSTTTQPSPSPFSQALGAGLGIAGTAGMLGWAPFAVSDRRIKEDVQKVGRLDNGLPVYTFRYKGDGQIHMGLMAQDVEKKNPDAVAEDSHGIKAVNYLEATKDKDGKYGVGGTVDGYADGGSIYGSPYWLPQFSGGNSIPKSPMIEQQDNGVPSGMQQLGLAALMKGIGKKDITAPVKAGQSDLGVLAGNPQAVDLSTMPFTGGVRNFESGGIVGYADGGDITADPEQDFLNATSDFQSRYGISQGQRPELAGLVAPQSPMQVPRGVTPMIPQGQSTIPNVPVISQAAQPTAMSELQRQLSENEPQIDKNMALLQAGLSIMGGRSPNAIQNIAQGAMAGLQQYAGQQQAVREYKLKEIEAEKEARRLAEEMDFRNRQLKEQEKYHEGMLGQKDIVPIKDALGNTRLVKKTDAINAQKSGDIYQSQSSEGMFNQIPTKAKEIWADNSLSPTPKPLTKREADDLTVDYATARKADEGANQASMLVDKVMPALQNYTSGIGAEFRAGAVAAASSILGEDAPDYTTNAQEINKVSKSLANQLAAQMPSGSRVGIGMDKFLQSSTIDPNNTPEANLWIAKNIKDAPAITSQVVALKAYLSENKISAAHANSLKQRFFKENPVMVPSPVKGIDKVNPKFEDPEYFNKWLNGKIGSSPAQGMLNDFDPSNPIVQAKASAIQAALKAGHSVEDIKKHLGLK